MFETVRSDWVFVILEMLFFFLALVITTWDFEGSGAFFRIGAINVAGIALFVVGAATRLVGRYYSYGLRTLRDHTLTKHRIYKYVRHPIFPALLPSYTT